MSEKKSFTRYEMTQQGHFKFYETWLEHKGGDNYDVAFKYGKIGTVGSMSFKAQSIGLHAATKWLENMEAERFQKGYKKVSPIKLGTNPILVVKKSQAQEISDAAESAPFEVMQPTAWPEDDVDNLLTSHLWGMQVKKNGKFIRFGTIMDKVTTWNKLGKQVALPAHIIEPLRMVANGKGLVVDGELIDQTYYLFDLFKYGAKSGDKMPFIERYKLLKELVIDGEQLAGSSSVQYVELITEGKTNIFKEYKKKKVEGVVFKKLGSVYIPGKVADRHIASSVKVKFWKEASVVAVKWTDKNSVEVSLYHDGSLFGVGKVTVPMKYKGQIGVIIGKPKIVRVKYLYASEDHQLVQASVDPDDTGNIIRDDQMLEECLRTQLQYEGDVGHVDDDEPKRSIIV